MSIIIVEVVVMRVLVFFLVLVLGEGGRPLAPAWASRRGVTVGLLIEGGA